MSRRLRNRCATSGVPLALWIIQQGAEGHRRPLPQDSGRSYASTGYEKSQLKKLVLLKQNNIVLENTAFYLVPGGCASPSASIGDPIVRSPGELPRTSDFSIPYCTLLCFALYGMSISPKGPFRTPSDAIRATKALPRAPSDRPRAPHDPKRRSQEASDRLCCC